MMVHYQYECCCRSNLYHTGRKDEARLLRFNLIIPCLQPRATRYSSLIVHSGASSSPAASDVLQLYWEKHFTAFTGASRDDRCF